MAKEAADKEWESATHEDVNKLAARSTLEELISSLTKRGNFNHLSISVDNTANGGRGKAFVAIFRDTTGNAPVRYMVGLDPVDVAKRALASIEIIYRDNARAAKKKAVTEAPAPSRVDDEDFL